MHSNLEKKSKERWGNPKNWNTSGEFPCEGFVTVGEDKYEVTWVDWTTIECPMASCKATLLRTGLWQHIKRKHQGNTFQCSVCKSIIGSKADCKRHERDQHGLHQACPRCPLVFDDKDHLTRHEKSQHKQRCMICNEHFFKGAEFTQHALEKHPDENLLDARIPLLKGRHKKAGTFSCVMDDGKCGQKFASANDLKTHSDLAHREQCTTCEQYFNKGNDIERHIRKAHRPRRGTPVEEVLEEPVIE